MRSLPKTLARWALPWVLIIGVCSGNALAQTATVSGTVSDLLEKDRLAGVSVALMLKGNLLAGTATDRRGLFTIPGVPPGAYTIKASYVGYEPVEQDLEVLGGNLEVHFQMVRGTVGLDEVEIVAETFQDSSDVRTSLYTITPRQARALAGGSDDVLRLVQALPGVLATSDLSSQIVVRGGDPNQNLILLDDVEIFSPYRMQGLGSVFNPSMVRGIELFTGGFPVPYGDRLASVLRVDTREGTQKDWLAGQADLSFSNAGLVLEGKTAFMNGSWIVGARRTFFDLLPAAFAEYASVFNTVAFPDFQDVQGKVVLRPDRGHRVEIQGLLSQDELSWLVQREVGEQGEEDSRTSNRIRNAMVGLSYTYTPNARFQSRIFGNLYQNSTDAAVGGFFDVNDAFPVGNRPGQPPPPPVFGQSGLVRYNYDQAFQFERFAIGSTMAWKDSRSTFEIGASIEGLRSVLDLDLQTNELGRVFIGALSNSPNWVGALTDSLKKDTPYLRYSLFIQNKINVANGRVFLQPGFRADYDELSFRGYASPRLNMSVVVGPQTTARFAWGVFRQTAGYEKLLDESRVFNLARYDSLGRLNPERAIHYVASIEQRLGTAWQVKLEYYYKALDNLIVQGIEDAYIPVARPANVSSLADPGSYSISNELVSRLGTRAENDSKGEAYGVEFLTEKKAVRGSERWSGWFSYTWALARREQAIRDGGRVVVPFDYDRRHAVNLVLNYNLNRTLAVSTTWRFGTGYPFTPPAGVEPLVANAEDPERPGRVIPVIATDPSSGYIRFIPRFDVGRNVNSARLPDYHRLDLRVTYRPDFATQPLDLYIDLVNLYNRRNVLYYRNFIEIIEDNRTGVPDALLKPPTPELQLEPVYMLPFLPTFGVRYSF